MSKLLDKKPPSRGVVVWIYGLSGAGKSTLAREVRMLLQEAGKATCILDGDALRSGLCQDLGFDERSRTENIRRAAEVARILSDCGLIVLASFMTPRQEQRHMAAKIVGEERFSGVCLDCPVTVCEQRDPKGLYQKFRSGLINGMIGLDLAFDPPDSADLVIPTSELAVADAARRLFDHLSDLLPTG